MDKEEILAKARQENKGVDQVKRQVQLKAYSISRSVGLAMCMLLTFIESVCLETNVIHIACWAIYATIVGTELWVHAIFLKKKGLVVAAVAVTVVGLALPFLAMRGL